MKQNVSETGSNWRFRKNVKTCLQKKKFYLMSLSKHGHFHPILILHLKIVKLPQQHASTTVHCLQILPLPSCKELYLKCGRVLRSVSENVAMHEN